MHRINKVPQITASFWVIKILTTGMGETLADFFDHTFEPLLVVLVSGVLLVLSFWLQLISKQFVAWRYWTAVSMVSVFGTLAADAVHVIFGVPYLISTFVFALGLALIIILWWLVEKNISIASITNPRTEVFYWAVVMATFALGTAAGDLSAMTFKLGFLGSGIVFALTFALPMFISSRLLKKSVTLFWLAYIVTRPLGASFADWLALPNSRGGMNLGTLPVSLILISCIVIFVVTKRTNAKK